MYDQDNLDIIMLKAVGVVDIDVIVCVYMSLVYLFITWTAPPLSTEETQAQTIAPSSPM